MVGKHLRRLTEYVALPNELWIESASIATGHPRQEEFMRSEPWLDAERHPLITFSGSMIEPLAHLSAGGVLAWGAGRDAAVQVVPLEENEAY